MLKCFNYNCIFQNQTEIIKKTAKFLNRTITNEQIIELSEHLKFSKMRTNPAVNLEHILKEKGADENNPDVKFIRKGKIGDWKNYMSADLSQKFDNWMQKNLENTDLKLDTESSIYEQ